MAHHEDEPRTEPPTARDESTEHEPAAPGPADVVDTGQIETAGLVVEPVPPEAMPPGATDPTVPLPDGVESTSPFGRPGRPLGQSPLLVGLFGGLGLLLAYSAFLALQNVLSILVLVFIALFLAIGLNPAVVRLQKFGLPRGGAVAAVGLGTVLMFGGALLALIPPLVTQTGQLIEDLPGYVDNLRRSGTLQDLNEQYQVLDRLKEAATAQNITKAAGGIWGGAQVVFSAIFNVLTVVVLTLYFMAAFERLSEGAYKLVPASRRQRVRLITDEILTKVGAYMAGALAIALIAGVSTFIFLLILGVAYPYALAVVVAITDLIPQVGATLGAIVVSIVGFAVSVPIGIACVIFFLVYQQLENFIIYPKVMRRAVKVSDLAAILGVLLGVALLGIVGALIAIPVVAAVQLIFREVLLPRQQTR